jgi:hypothetical protein
LTAPSKWLITVPSGWTNVSCEESDELRLCRLSRQQATQCQPLVVSHSLIVKADYSWMLNVHGHLVDPSGIPSLGNIPPLLDSRSTTTLLQILSSVIVCVGNPDPDIISLCDKKKNKEFLSANRKVIAYLDSGFIVMVDGQEYTRTVRCSTCVILIDNGCIHCESCTNFHKIFLTTISRMKHTCKHVQKNTVNYRFMKTPERLIAMRSVKKRLRVKEQKLSRMKKRLESMTLEKGVAVGVHVQEEIDQVIKERKIF